MSAESPADSRPPQTNSANADSGPESAVSENDYADLAKLPDPSEKVREFLDEFGERAHVRLSTEHGRKLRPECFEEEKEVSQYVTESGETEQVEEVTERRAVPLWQAVANMLEWHENYHKSTLRLEYGNESDPTHSLLDVDLENSWFAAYQDKERARLKALERETCGYETCDECDTRYCSEQDEHETEHVAGVFEEPVVALTGRTASGAGRPPVDHAREIADAWSSGGVRRSLRYQMDKLGLDNAEWVRWTQGEPHPGDGQNQGYHHTHDIVILDGAAANGEITAATFRPVIESHVEACDHAGPEAHDLDKSAEQWAEGEVETVTVKQVDGEIKESVASYAAAYLANEEVDLLERPPEYLAWAATMWATNTQKATGTDSRTHAITADRCRHKHAEGEQELAHGEQVTYSTKRGYKAECLACGSPWEVEQSETLVAAKRVAGPDVAAADGGAVPGEETDEQRREEELRDTWQTARAGAVVGGRVRERDGERAREGREIEEKELRMGGGRDWCPACHTEEPAGDECPSEHYEEHPIIEGRDGADETVTVGSEQYRGTGHVPFEYEEPPESPEVRAAFERAPSWSAKAILRDGEEIPATGGTTEKKPLDLPSAPVRVVSMASRVGAKVVCKECDKWCDTPKEYVEHECEGRVAVGWLPATEAPAEESVLSHEEFVEAVPDRLLGEGRAGDCDDELELGEEVSQYIEHTESVTAPEVLGKFNLAPEQREQVAEVVGSE